MVPAQAYVAKFLESFKEFPPTWKLLDRSGDGEYAGRSQGRSELTPFGREFLQRTSDKSQAYARFWHLADQLDGRCDVR